MAPTVQVEKRRSGRQGRHRAGPQSVQQLRRAGRECRRLVCKIPFQQYIQAVAQELHTLNRDHKEVSHILHQASRAYVRGLKGDVCCGPAAKSEGTNFLLCLAWMGLRQMVTMLSNDKVLTKKIKKNEDQYQQDEIHGHGHHHHHHGHHHHPDGHHHNHHEAHHHHADSHNHHGHHHHHNQEHHEHHHHAEGHYEEDSSSTVEEENTTASGLRFASFRDSSPPSRRNSGEEEESSEVDIVSNEETTITSEAEEAEEGESQRQNLPSKSGSKTCHSNERTCETEVEEALTDLELD